MSDWIHGDQNGFLPNRRIRDNIRNLLNLIEIHEKNVNKELAMIFLDAEKAFDNVRWEFIVAVLRKMEIGDTF